MEQTAVASRPDRPASYRRWLRRANLRNVPMLLVIAVSAAGLGYSAALPPHWLRGVMVLAGAMLIAGVLRLILPARQAGLLAVRSRFVDVFFYGAIGGSIIFLGVTLASAGQS